MDSPLGRGLLAATELGAGFATGNLLKCSENCYSLLPGLRAEVIANQQTGATTTPGCIAPLGGALWPSEEAFLFKSGVSENQARFTAQK